MAKREVILKGIVAVQKKKGPEDRYFVLYKESLEYFTQEDDFKKGLEARGKAVLKEVAKNEVQADGFTLTLKDGVALALKVKDDKERKKWADAIDKLLLEVNKADAKADTKAADAKADPKTAAKEDPKAAAKEDPKAAAKADPKGDSKKEEAVATAKKPVPFISGQMNVEHKGKVIRPFFVLTLDSLDRFDDEADYNSGKASKGSMVWQNVETIETISASFKFSIWLKAAKKATDVWLDNDKEFEQWKPKFEKAIGKKLTEAKQSSSGSTTPIDGGSTPRAAATGPVLRQGTLNVIKKGKEEPRHFVIYQDRFEYYTAEEDFKKGEKPRGVAQQEDFGEYEVTKDGIFSVSLKGQAKKLEFKTPDSKERPRWEEAWDKLFKKDKEDDKKDAKKDDKKDAKKDDKKDTDQKAAAKPAKPAKAKLISEGRFRMAETKKGAKKPEVKQILLALREDGIEYFSKNQTSVDGVADGHISTKDIEDLEVEDDGFTFHLIDGRIVALTEPVDKSVDDWIEEFQNIFEETEEEEEVKKVKTEPAPAKKADSAVGFNFAKDDSDSDKEGSDFDFDDSDKDEDKDEDDSEDEAPWGKDDKEDKEPAKKFRMSIMDPNALRLKQVEDEAEEQEDSDSDEDDEEDSDGDSPGGVVKFKRPRRAGGAAADLGIERYSQDLLYTVGVVNKILKQGRKLYGKQVNDAESFFAAVDTDEDGAVDMEDIGEALKRLGVQVKDVVLENLILAMDTDEENCIGLPQLKKALQLADLEAARKGAIRINEQWQQAQKAAKRVRMSIHAPISRASVLSDKSGRSWGITSDADREKALMQIIFVVNKSISAPNRKLFGKRVKDAASLFAALDQNDNGVVDRSELEKGLKRMGVNITASQMDYFIDYIGEEGEIKKEVLVKALGQEESEAKKIEEKKAASLQKKQLEEQQKEAAERQKQGMLLKKALEQISFEDFPKNEDGEIGQEEFEKWRKELATKALKFPGEMEDMSTTSGDDRLSNIFEDPASLRTLAEGPVMLTVGEEGPEKRYAILTGRNMEFFASRDEQKGGMPPRTALELRDMISLEVGASTFKIVTRNEDAPRMTMKNRQNFGIWKKAMKEAVEKFCRQNDKGVWVSNRAQSQSKADHVGAGDSRVIHKGPLKLAWRGHSEVRYFIVYADRFEHFQDATAAENNKFAGRVWATDIRSVRVTENAFTFGLEKDNMDLRVPSGEDMEPWVAAFRELQRNDSSTAKDSDGLGNVKVRGHFGNQELLKQDRQKLVGSDAYVEMMDESVQQWIRKLPERHLHHGLLGFQHQGRLQARFSILFKDRIDSWCSPIKASNGGKTDSTISLHNVRGVETISAGFILNLGGRKVGVHVGENEDLQDWSRALLQALAPAQGKSPATTPRAVSSPSGAASTTASTPRTPRARSVSGTKPANWVPEVASKMTRSLEQERKGPRSITTVFAHTRGDGKYGPFRVNSNAKGGEAMKLIHGSTATTLPSSKSPGFSTYNSSVAEKIGSLPTRSSSSPALNRNHFDAETSDKVTGGGRKCAPASKAQFAPQCRTFKVSSEEAVSGHGFAAKPTARGDGRAESRERASQHYPKVTGEERQVSPKSKVNAVYHGAWSKIGTEDQKPLRFHEKAHKERWMGKVTDSARLELTGWASPNRRALADKVKSMAEHATKLKPAAPPSPPKAAGAASAA